jgi:uracil-DNA glycosylase family 4
MAEFNPRCTRCPRLAAHLREVRAQHPDYHARPVPPFGDAKAGLLIVGLAPGRHGANRTGRPFTGDHAGILLYETLYRYGFADRPVSEHAADGLRLLDCRITNAVKCLPPENKPTQEEINCCNKYLQTELHALDDDSAVLALGRIAHQAVLRALGFAEKDHPFAHGAIHRLPRLVLFDSYHCSRYNTQTRRLTPAMFEAVFEAIRGHLQRS